MEAQSLLEANALHKLLKAVEAINEFCPLSLADVNAGDLPTLVTASLAENRDDPWLIEVLASFGWRDGAFTKAFNPRSFATRCAPAR